jgi:endoglucanase
MKTKIILLLFSVFALGKTFAQNPALMYGVNLAGAEFGTNFPGTFGADYTYPTNSDFDYFATKGLKLIRIPFKWERIQPTMNAALNTTELNRLTAAVDYAQTKGMYVVLDLHNYGRRNINYTEYIIGSGTVTVAHIKDCWTRLAEAFKNKTNIYGYGIMNEPHDMLQNTPWLGIAQEIINGIRTADLTTSIIVGGDDWSSGERWVNSSSNLKNLTDASNKLIFEAHIYFDDNAAGYYDQTYDGEGAYANIGVDRATPFVNWLKTNNLKGYVGEYGIPANDARWNTALSNFLTYLQSNCVNGTAWAAGPWWGNYILSLQPSGNTDKPQMATLTNFLTIPINNCGTLCNGSQPNLGNDQTICGGSTTLNSNVSAGNGISFAWYKNNTLINNAASSTYAAASSGTYKVVVTTNGCDKSDELILTVNSGLNTVGDTICSPGEIATLKVTTPGGPYTWYEAATGGSALYTGSTYSIAVNSTKDYFVEGGAAVRTSIGPKAPLNNPSTSNLGWYFNYATTTADSLRLDLDVAATIDSIDIYSDYAATDKTLKFTVYNSAGAQVGQTIYTIPMGSQYILRIPIGISLNAGTGYKLTLAGTQHKLWYDGSDAPYPYIVTGIGTIKWGLASWGADGMLYPSMYNIILSTSANAGGCGRALVKAFMDVCTESKEITSINTSVFPNPSSENFTLQLHNLNEVRSIAVYDLSGKKVEDVAASSGKIIFGSDLTSGIYILSVKTAQEQINCKVIKY